MDGMKFCAMRKEKTDEREPFALAVGTLRGAAASVCPLARTAADAGRQQLAASGSRADAHAHDG